MLRGGCAHPSCRKVIKLYNKSKRDVTGQMLGCFLVHLFVFRAEDLGFQNGLANLKWLNKYLNIK